MKLTEHFTLEEFEESDTATRLGIDNAVPKDLLDNITTVAKGMESVWSALGGVPIHNNSGYRCKALNTAIGGASKSDHMLGLACDFVAPEFGTPAQICAFLAKTDIQFNRLIMEHGWVHISFVPFGIQPAREVLTATFIDGKATYSKGLA